MTVSSALYLDCGQLLAAFDDEIDLLASVAPVEDLGPGIAWFRFDDDTDLCYHCEIGKRPHQHMPIDWDSDLWRELTRLADEGDEHYQQLVQRMREEERAAQRAA